MSGLGISAFPGLEQTLEQNLAYLFLAQKLGYSRLFTSLHIPESDPTVIVQDAVQLVNAARNMGFEVSADISPVAWERFGFSLEEIGSLGVTTLRIDYGLNPEQILTLAAAADVRIELNASTMDEEKLSAFLAAGFSVANLQAGHNYYPRPETGLSYDLFHQRSSAFKRKGISVSAFIPSKGNPRGPIFAGLPTLEAHRQMSSVDAARQLWASGLVDTVLFGDPCVPEEELAAVAGLSRRSLEKLTFRVVLMDSLPEWVRGLLFSMQHTNRHDPSPYCARSMEARLLCREKVHPIKESIRRRGDVTLDNENYGRYRGELQIVLQDLPADERVNVLGRIAEEDLCLLDCLTPGRSFDFLEVLR